MVTRCVVGISGATCAGKTSLLNKLKQKFNNVSVFHQDDYYYDEKSSHHVMIPELKHPNYELITAFDMERMVRDVQQSVEGNTSSHLILLDGIMLFSDPQIWQLCDLRYFLTLGEEECLKRRLTRCYDPPDPSGYFQLIAWPSYKSHFEQIRYKKDLCFLAGEDAMEITYERVYKDIRERLQEMS